MTVVITGANGFMGLHLVRDQLAQGATVRAVDLHVERLQRLAAGEPGLEVFQADIRDLETMKNVVAGAEIVFHLASAHLAVSLGEDAYWRINRDGARALARLCGQAGVGRFIHCSTVGVYGEITAPPADETTPCHPDLIYEKSKLAGEEAVREEARQVGLPLVVIRPVWVYGPGCPRTEKIFRSLRKGTFAFIGDAKAVTLRELLNHMAAAAGCRKPWIRLPLFLARPLFAAAGHLFLSLKREPPVSARTLKIFTNNTAFSIAKARKLLGFTPRYDVAEGMRRTWAQINERAAGGN